MVWNYILPLYFNYNVKCCIEAHIKFRDFPYPEFKTFCEMYKIIIMKEMVLSEILLSQTVCINWQFNK